MDSIFFLGCIFLFGSVAAQVVPAITTPAPRQDGPVCPSFPSRYREDDLVIDLSNQCEMVVAVNDMTHLFPGFQQMWQIPNSGRIYLPSVRFERPQNSSTIDCPLIPMKYLGPRIALDTVPGRCQIVFGIRTFPVLPANATTATGGFSGQVPLMARYVTRAVFERTNGLL